MKKKRTSVEVTQEMHSQTMVPSDLYLSDDCWEHIFRFLIDDNNCRYLKFLSVVSKQFLSITNRIRFSLTIWNSNVLSLPRFFQRFPNLTSLNFSCFCYDLDIHLPIISNFPFKITSLNISNKPVFPAIGLRAFSQNIKTLTSLTCSNVGFDYNKDLFLIADYFPLLQILDLTNIKCFKVTHPSRMHFEFLKLEVLNLSFTTIDDEELCIISKTCRGLLQLLLKNCRHVTEKGVKHVSENCTQLREMDIESCSRVKLQGNGMNFEFPKLEVLNLSLTSVDDEELDMISKGCRWLLKLLLNSCWRVTEKGVKRVLENCTQLREIDIRRCSKMHPNFVASMVFSRPSLRKIIAPPGCILSDMEKKLLALCLVC